MNPSSTRRAVAIVGRPNVGKSALFNCLAGRRVAIVHAERGVTRDRLVQEVRWGAQRFELIDTGGLGPLNQEPAAATPGDREIQAGVQRQAEIAIQEAAAILFVTDTTAGILPLDGEIADFLRRSGRPVFLLANKTDNPARDIEAAEFEKFGFPVFPVSAVHRRGLEAVMQTVLPVLPPAVDDTLTNPLKVTIVGRPNVGKSSLINQLLHSDRVIVSAVPGTTRDSIDIPFVIGHGQLARHYLLTDTAGIRRQGRWHSRVDQLSLDRAEKSIARADIAALVLDAAQGPTAQDKAIADLVLEQHKGCVILVNKWDLLKGAKPQAYREALYAAAPFLGFVPVVAVSAKTGFNMSGIVAVVEHVASQVRAQLPTGVLNRIVMDAYDRVQPPYMGAKRLKIFYVTQVGVAPVTIVLFVNDPRICPPAYEHYLIRSVRQAFGLEGAPVVLRWRARRSSVPQV